MQLPVTLLLLALLILLRHRGHREVSGPLVHRRLQATSFGSLGGVGDAFELSYLGLSAPVAIIIGCRWGKPGHFGKLAIRVFLLLGNRICVVRLV